MWNGNREIGLRGPICICLRFHWEHRACSVSQGYLLSARQWLPVPAEQPELQEPELAAFQRRAYQCSCGAAASRAKIGTFSLTVAHSSRKPSKEEKSKKPTTVVLIIRTDVDLRWPHLLQVSWVLLGALCKSSLGTFIPNKPSSLLSLFYPRWREASFFSLSLEALLPIPDTASQNHRLEGTSRFNWSNLSTQNMT